jgi:hypothetical protein
VDVFNGFVDMELSDDAYYGVVNNLKACLSELFVRQYILSRFSGDVVIRYEPSFLNPCDAMFKFMLPLDESTRRATCERFRLKLFDKTGILLPEGVDIEQVKLDETSYEPGYLHSSIELPSLVFNLRLGSTWDVISSCPLIEAKLRQDLERGGSVDTDYVNCLFNSDAMTCIPHRYHAVSMIKHANIVRVEASDFIDLVHELLCIQACINGSVNIQRLVDFLVVKVDGGRISDIHLIEAKSVENQDEEYKVRRSVGVYGDCLRKCGKHHKYTFEVVNTSINIPRRARLKVTKVTNKF